MSEMLPRIYLARHGETAWSHNHMDQPQAEVFEHPPKGQAYHDEAVTPERSMAARLPPR